MSDKINEKEMLEELEVELSAEEQALEEINNADDGEQVRVHSLHEHGTPQKYIVYRSQKANKQVLVKPQYHELKETDGESVIGYLRKSDTKTIQDYGTENKLELDITGEQRRGE